MSDKSNKLSTISLDDLQIDLTEDELKKISLPSSVSEFQREKLEKCAKKNWDLFYKRNGNRFFKNRYWTRREFQELFISNQVDERKYLLEIGCGCGDFVLPLLDPQLDQDNQIDDNLMAIKANSNLFIYCCDISSIAIDVLKENSIYKRFNPERIKAFVADVTEHDCDMQEKLDNQLMDFVSLIFVFSALEPNKMINAVKNIVKLLKTGGLILFRDYALYDKAMLRFSESSKISEQFYLRQDGTRAYFFTKEKLLDLFDAAHFQCQSIEYIKRETINNASKATFSRIFLQAKFKKKL